MNRTFEFEELRDAALVVDAVYKGGTAGNASDDPLARLLPCGNQGGFRLKLAPGREVAMVVLFTTLGHQDWPDSIDLERGLVTYFGDNRSPGRELHDTPRGGNRLLREFFTASQGGAALRQTIPPFLVFSRGALGRDVVFRGLAVPGSDAVEARDQLVAVWRGSQGQRFQNYRSVFTILDVPVIARAWIDALAAGTPDTAAPEAWSRWRATGRYLPLLAPKTSDIRTRTEQEPPDAEGKTQIEMIRNHFADDHTAFEPCAARLFQMAEASPVTFEVTQRVRDGGRDAVGLLRVGNMADGIHLDFALEAKCYGPTNSVGVRDMSRLISRLRHRQFGVLVTTSVVDRQAYAEVRDDGHPIVILAARDIVRILREHGISTRDETKAWLDAYFAPTRRGEPRPARTARRL